MCTAAVPDPISALMKRGSRVHPLGERVRIMGVPVDVMSEGAVVDHILDEIDLGNGGWVITPNVDILRKASRDRSISQLIGLADLVVADGMPVVWASRLMRRPVPERVAGSALVWSLTEGAARRNAPVFLLGGNPGAAARAAGVLTDQFPGLVVSGHHCPPLGFESSPAEMEEIFGAIAAAQPRIVFCGLGFPKQEQLISKLRSQFPSTWFLGVGISLSMVGGEVARSPRWMQQAGLEWLHRLIQEPTRLFARYILGDVPFACRLLAWAAFTGLISARAPLH